MTTERVRSALSVVPNHRVVDVRNRQKTAGQARRNAAVMNELITGA